MLNLALFFLASQIPLLWKDLLNYDFYSFFRLDILRMS